MASGVARSDVTSLAESLINNIGIGDGVGVGGDSAGAGGDGDGDGEDVMNTHGNAELRALRNEMVEERKRVSEARESEAVRQKADIEKRRRERKGGNS